MTATTETTWNRNEVTGQYTSGCGRFTIIRFRNKWSVTDTTRQDPVVPQYKLSACYHTLASAKSQARRWLAGRN